MNPYDSDEDFLKDIRKIFDDEEAHKEEDPYERGFADKLYEDYEPEAPAQQAERPQAPAIRAYNTDFQRDRPKEAPERRYREETRQRPREKTARPEPKRSTGRNSKMKEQPSKRKSKKRSPLRVLWRILLVLLLLFAVLIGVMLLLAKQPVAADGLGARKNGSSTILLAGTDESGDRTDTIMLLNVNRRDKRISVMSIPRDTKVNSSYTPHKINGAYGVNGKDEEGMEALMDYVSDCVGFRPDGYILIDLDVFVDLVDLMGGVKFDVPCDMYYNDASQDLFINLSAGLQKLDGEQAMGLVRFRTSYAMADLERVNVQRNFISAALDQWISLKNLWKMPSVARLISANTLTDLSTRNLVWLAESVAICGTDNIQMMTIPSSLSGDGMYVLVDPWETVDTINDCFNPYETEITVDDLSPGY